MNKFSRTIAAANTSILRVFGEQIIYTPLKGRGAPVEALAILRPDERDQPTSPGYFAEIEVDPTVIDDPQRWDEVLWTDDVVYVVAKIQKPKDSLTILTLHKKLDA